MSRGNNLSEFSKSYFVVANLLYNKNTFDFALDFVCQVLDDINENSNSVDLNLNRHLELSVGSKDSSFVNQSITFLTLSRRPKKKQV